MPTFDTTSVTFDSTQFTLDEVDTPQNTAPAAINDVYHYWGTDLQLSNSGDLLLANGTLRGQQRILRRLMTNPGKSIDALPGDYIWHSDYGGGLPQFIGLPNITTDYLISLTRGQILMEDSVAKSPPPEITVQRAAGDNTAVFEQINYTDAPSNAPVVLAFNVSA